MRREYLCVYVKTILHSIPHTQAIDNAQGCMRLSDKVDLLLTDRLNQEYDK